MSTSTEEAIAIGQAGAALNAEKDKRRIFGDTGDSNTDPVVMSRDIDMNGFTIYGLPSVGGLQGPQGEQGEEGPTGLTGPMGPQGATGPQGAKGDTGATGPQGPQGERGLKGDKGDTGPQGVKGDAGATGAQGPAGPQGAVGPQGPAGSTGSTGPQGDTGPAGPTGNTGPAGATGATGPAGASLNFRGAWATATPYALLDVVRNNGTSYRCVGAHTSASTDEPGVGVNSSTYWSILAKKGDTGATGSTGPAGADGTDGVDGADGVGVPAGGTTGQVLAKNSNADHDTEWVDPGAGSTPDNLQVRNITIADTAISAGYSSYIPEFLEVGDTFVYEVGLESCLEVG